LHMRLDLTKNQQLSDLVPKSKRIPLLRAIY
jgi:hypothetical protein